MKKNFAQNINSYRTIKTYTPLIFDQFKKNFNKKERENELHNAHSFHLLYVTTAYKNVSA
jgi:hypothetical protein